MMFQKAFITDRILELGAESMPTVVTAKRLQNGRLAIYIAPTDPVKELCGLMITLTSDDLCEVQKLLGEDGRRWVPADDEGAVPDEDIAWAALRKIAELDQIRNEDETWKTIAMRAIDYAQDALGRMDDNGTPTNA